eukprot:Gb_08673 [translate_table: standard]
MARLSNDSPVAGSNPLSDTEESSQEDCLPFLFDDDSHGHVGRSPFSSKKLPFTDSHLCGIPDNSAMAGRIPSSTNLPSGKELGSGNTEVDSKEQCTGPSHQIQKPSNIGVFRAPVADAEQGLLSNPSSKVVDPFDSIEQEYVFVPISSSELSSSSLSASGLGQSAAKVVGSPIKKLQKSPTVSAPMPIVGAAVGSVGGVGNLGSLGSRPSGTSQGSIDLGDVVDQPSVHPPTRLQSLVQCAHAITELVNDKLDTGKQVEAFLIQLVCLAIWSEALRVCHTWAAFATEGSPSQDVIGSNNLLSKKGSVSVAEMSEDLDLKRAAAACSRVEREFLFAVEHAEELAKYLVPLEGSAEMPDAMEIIFQAALASGRSGAKYCIWKIQMHQKEQRLYIRYSAINEVTDPMAKQCASPTTPGAPWVCLDAPGRTREGNKADLMCAPDATPPHEAPPPHLCNVFMPITNWRGVRTIDVILVEWCALSQ